MRITRRKCMKVLGMSGIAVLVPCTFSWKGSAVAHSYHEEMHFAEAGTEYHEPLHIGIRVSEELDGQFASKLSELTTMAINPEEILSPMAVRVSTPHLSGCAEDPMANDLNLFVDPGMKMRREGSLGNPNTLNMYLAAGSTKMRVKDISPSKGESVIFIETHEYVEQVCSFTYSLFQSFLMNGLIGVDLSDLIAVSSGRIGHFLSFDSDYSTVLKDLPVFLAQHEEILGQSDSFSVMISYRDWEELNTDRISNILEALNSKLQEGAHGVVTAHAHRALGRDVMVNILLFS